MIPYTRPASLLFSLLISLFLCIIMSAPLFAECILGDCQNGSGTFLFPGGSKYMGEWENGQMSGKGMFIFSSGAKYSGEWQKGELIQYSNLEKSQINKTGLTAEEINRKIQNYDFEKRFLDTDFDPSIELPVPAAGAPPKNE